MRQILLPLRCHPPRLVLVGRRRVLAQQNVVALLVHGVVAKQTRLDVVIVVGMLSYFQMLGTVWLEHDGLLVLKNSVAARCLDNRLRVLLLLATIELFDVLVELLTR